MEYVVIYETGESGGYSAYAPDLPGCVAAAKTLEACKRLMKEAIEFHIEGLKLQLSGSRAYPGRPSTVLIGRIA